MNKQNVLFRYQENLKRHAIRVMAVVEQVMHRLDEEGSVIKVSYMFKNYIFCLIFSIIYTMDCFE